MGKAVRKPGLDQSKREAMGMLAGQSARQHITDACIRAGLTVEKTAKAVADALDAHMVRAQLTMQGTWAVSEEFVDHVTRLKAVEQAEVLLDLKPTIKSKVDIASALTDDEIENQLNNLLKKEGK